MKCATEKSSSVELNTQWLGKSLPPQLQLNVKSFRFLRSEKALGLAAYSRRLVIHDGYVEKSKVIKKKFVFI